MGFEKFLNWMIKVLGIIINRLSKEDFVKEKAKP
jgi:hypothetical protein